MLSEWADALHAAMLVFSWSRAVQLETNEMLYCASAILPLAELHKNFTSAGRQHKHGLQ
jgi:hypothetical protein